MPASRTAPPHSGCWSSCGLSWPRYWRSSPTAGMPAGWSPFARDRLHLTVKIVAKPEGLQGLRSPAPPVGGRAHLRLADALPPTDPRLRTAACHLRSIHQVGDDRDHDPTARPTIRPPPLATKPATSPLLKHVLTLWAARRRTQRRPYGTDAWPCVRRGPCQPADPTGARCRCPSRPASNLSRSSAKSRPEFDTRRVFGRPVEQDLADSGPNSAF